MEDLKEGNISRSFEDFGGEFHAMLKIAEKEAKKQTEAPRLVIYWFTVM